MSKYHLITHGCQMNKNDSQRLAGVLLGIGMEESDKPDDADLILINTCSVRKSAEDRVFGKMKNFGKMRKKGKDVILGVTGCMPGRDRDGALEKKFPMVDLFFPIEEMVKLPQWLSSINPSLVDSGSYEEDYLKIHPIRDEVRQAYVTIQTGCNKFCTYCVVPFARGFEKNRSVQDILDEIRELAIQGCVEVTLLGQTVNSFEAIDSDSFSDENPYSNHFAKLLWEVNQIEGIKRLHFTAPHPLHMDDEIIDAMTLPAHLNFLHIPVQAGSDVILRRMNRRHGRQVFIDLIKKIREKIPDIALGTDMIVGYCGETEEDFQQTVDLYKECDFDISYIAQYSARTGTVGHKAWDDDVSVEDKKRRWREMQSLMEETVLRKNQKFRDAVVSVLADTFKSVEGESEKGWVIGNSREMKRVQFPGTRDMVGEIHDVKISKPLMWILYGTKI
ncbi:MAG: tRNA (N6-isopentenyl adenosine(37)-C2)-methylthiotransferase MiaB [Parcubacteria group bacterium]|nr:tRNA (N6-isopentenyl adenosine(37)-C2)-methylthiotransferase MiaB [Parcubacteria group bacterium]